MQQQPQLRTGLTYPDSSNLPEDQLLNWNDPTATSGMGTVYPDPSAYEISNVYGANPAASIPQGSGPLLAPTARQNSNQLVRRNTNQELAARGISENQSAWQDFGSPAMIHGGGGAVYDNDEDGDLAQRAQVAKRDAQAKRKQIPPFVQKLSSFLDEDRNTDLIRWSDDGNSFIVLDEDEFAKTLIPELFKHNNYASFVRQLNMYGFHKRVGLGDGSMKASEQKRKPPSEYFNKYFKQGRPDLLWLIQKPKNVTANAKRKKNDGTANEQGESDGETMQYPPGPPGDSGGDGSNQDLVAVSRTELQRWQEELQELQRQQKYISQAITAIRRQNEQFYQQASAFQTLHDRHENSINAILTFLATFYNRSLEGNANIADMFKNTVPQNSQEHGNVFDVGDYAESAINAQNQFHRTGRRPLALLPAPTVNEKAASAGRDSIASASARSTLSPRPTHQTARSSSQTKSSGSTPRFTSADSPVELKTEAETPNLLSQVPESTDMMSVINNVNNLNGVEASSLDLPATLDQYQTASGAPPLTPQQRNEMLNAIAASSAPNVGSLAALSSAGQNGNGNDPLASPNVPPIPSLDHFVANQAQIEMLQKLQEEQAIKVQNLAERLVPLSPTGAIPGLPPSDANDMYGGIDGGLGAPSDFDLNHFISSGDYFSTNDIADGDLFGDLDVDFNAPPDPNMFGWDGTNRFGDRAEQDGGGGRVESITSVATSPSTTADAGNEESGSQESGSSRKRRRRN
ncbi:Heat shock transcription factor [Coniosporium tulheliwenetii]|uniref:Heat shock transcription factor n=1 Tax=Coniosporium tulheliwenetii TaxID=3383036 RepID=A0ACC2Z5L2_9PEZI|nr:Heat shock transcription factor [Cladosporium sp. JES 115]